ncbi:uncharacterized protein LOC112560623 [Pomacea canaliculata]|uniref:uncharacterized protein LOC112560623 n=1 Tax=Pomacea canaliculata TaxID=400727 RepID=UPI000D734528|nr:uncharacterized protein LOC112560623 [Pomacea canaliculata]
MALRQPFLVVTVTLWVRLILSGNVTGSDREKMCHQGYTGSDNGGSCTFSTGLCGWTETGVNTKWEIKDQEAFASTYRTSEGTKAILTSPWMCEDGVVSICIRFSYKFDDDDGGQLTLRLCNETDNCEVLWFEKSGYENEWSWCQLSRNLTLTKRDLFKIQIEAKKIDDTWFSDTNFYIDNIVYKNTSCPNEPMVTPTQHPVLTTGEMLTTNTDADFLTPKMSKTPLSSQHTCYDTQSKFKKMLLDSVLLDDIKFTDIFTDF